MKASIVSTNVELNPLGGFSRPSLSATIRLYGDSEELRNLIETRHTYLELVEPKREFLSDIQVGDEIRYNFLRNGTDPEVSIWMIVKEVKGDLIVASNNGPRGPYKFRIHRCQLVDWNRPGALIRADHTHVEPDHKSLAESRQFKSLKQVEKAYKENTDADPTESLRKQILEFNLV